MELSSAIVENIIYGIIGISAILGVAYKTWKKAMKGEDSALLGTSELLTNDQHIIKEIFEVKEKVENVYQKLKTTNEDIFYLKNFMVEMDKDNKREDITRQEMYKILIKLEDRTNG